MAIRVIIRVIITVFDNMLGLLGLFDLVQAYLHDLQEIQGSY